MKKPDNVIRLNCPQNNMIMTLEDALQRVKDGKVTGFVLSMHEVNEDTGEDYCTRGNVCTEATNILMLLGQLEREKKRLLDMLE